MQDELLREPVWQEDIEQELEYLSEGCRNLLHFFQRAQMQGAPQELLTELWTSYQHLWEAHRRLQMLVPCFSAEPKG